MFYQYPEEFIVPVIYTKDLILEVNDIYESNYGYRSFMPFREEVSEIIEEEMEKEELFNEENLEEENDERIFEGNENNIVSEYKIDRLNESFQEESISDNTDYDDLEYKKINNTLSEIDNEYANGEIGIV